MLKTVSTEGIAPFGVDIKEGAASRRDTEQVQPIVANQMLNNGLIDLVGRLVSFF